MGCNPHCNARVGRSGALGFVAFLGAPLRPLAGRWRALQTAGKSGYPMESVGIGWKSLQRDQ